MSSLILNQRINLFHFVCIDADDGAIHRLRLRHGHSREWEHERVDVCGMSSFPDRPILLGWCRVNRRIQSIQHCFAVRQHSGEYFLDLASNRTGRLRTPHGRKLIVMFVLIRKGLTERIVRMNEKEGSGVGRTRRRTEPFLLVNVFADFKHGESAFHCVCDAFRTMQNQC